jgi:hypothetical protein
MKRAVLLLLLGACTKDSGEAPAQRAAARRTGGTTFELIPSAGQLPYCLAFTQSSKGVTRQLTMSSANTSFDCKGGKPVGGRAFKVPTEEGAVKMYVLFSSEPINAASVAQQLVEHKDLSSLSVMDLRLPGRAALEVLEFAPEADAAPAEGQVLGGVPEGERPRSSAAPETDGGP